MGNPNTYDIDLLFAQDGAPIQGTPLKEGADCTETDGAMNDEEFEPEPMSEVDGGAADEHADSLSSKKIVEELLQRSETDCGAPFEEVNLRVLLALRDENYPEWMRVRARIKSANKDVSLIKLDRAISRLGTSLKEVAPTHFGYAKDIWRKLSVERHSPVTVHGVLYVPQASSQLWVPMSFSELQASIAEAHDGQANCFRQEDYHSIAKVVLTLKDRSSFFEDAPEGVACVRSFYSVRDGAVCKERLGLKHRQTVALGFEPEELPTPLYDAFMRETFCSTVEGEEEGQRRLMEEFAGAVMLGVAHRYEKAFAWLDRYGRAGKGTLEKIYNKLVPAELCSAASPTLWGKEYSLAMMAGKRLNVVGELAEHLPIPAAEFKSVLGRDEVVGRFPMQPPFTFRNTAGHLFMSNHMIRTNDHSAAFFSRWLLAEFPNSRLKSGLPLDVGLSERIAKSEMPGIAYKVLQAGARVLHQGSYSLSKVHDRLMAQWQRSASSVDEFIHEECELQASFHFRRAEFYRAYVHWCTESGRKPLSKGRVKEMLEHNLKMGIKLATLDGYEIFRGIRMKPDLTAESDLDDPSVSAPVSDQPADF